MKRLFRKKPVHNVHEHHVQHVQLPKRRHRLVHHVKNSKLNHHSKRYLRHVRRRAIAYLAIGILLFFGAIIYQNAKASNLLAQATDKMAKGQFKTASLYLEEADKTLVYWSLKKQIQEAQNQNSTWIFYSLEVNRADFLIQQGKFDEASAVLERIGRDFPIYTRVAALQRLIEDKIKELAKKPTPVSRPRAAKPRQAATTQVDTHLTRPTNFKAVPPVKTLCYQVGGSAGRSGVDRPDDREGYQIHIIYALPSDGTDRDYDVNNRIVKSVSAWQNWLCNKTSGQTLILDTYQGNLDISFVRLGASNQALKSGSELPWETNPDKNPYIYNDIESRLTNLGFNQPNKIYLVYYDGDSNYSCGSAGTNGMVYLTSDICRAGGALTTDVLASGYWEFTMLHEAMHALGFIPACAPDYSSNHVLISNKDLMYGGNEAWQPSELDATRSNYYKHSNPNCLDLAKSAFLTGGGAELPPWYQ